MGERKNAASNRQQAGKLRGRREQQGTSNKEQGTRNKQARNKQAS
jgi:hypothetical protein